MQHVVRGRGSLNRENITPLMGALSVRKPLLVCGKRMAQVFAQRVGLDLPVFSGYHPNPDLLDCADGAAMYRDCACDGLISLGGGSAMDTAKGIKSMLLCADLDDVRTSCLPEDVRLPHIAIPGTAGTGAEATPIAVVYEHNEKLSLDHPALLPEAIVLDGSLLDTLPDYHRKACAMDALCQGIESYWAVKATPESRIHAEKAITGVLRHISVYLAGDADAQEAMLEAAYESGCAIRISRTTAAHAMSYQITKRIGPAHGHACILTLPHLWQHLLSGGQHQAMLDALAAKMNVRCSADVPLLLQGMIAALGLEMTEMPEDPLLDALAASVNTQRLGNHPEPLTTAMLRDIYRQAFTPLTGDAREAAIMQWRHYAG